MFYPLTFLRRGGKFHMCWIADCHPDRLNSRLKRMLMEKDICSLCEDMKEFVISESGSPSNRFSLRLSSQLMRGLVRLYDKKLTMFLEHLCMFNALVWQHTNMITVTEDASERRHIKATSTRKPRVRRGAPSTAAVIATLEKSDNVVARVADITIREDDLPMRELPADGFGEEPELNVELLELMRAPETSVQHHSGLELNMLDVTERSRDQTRLAIRPQMENINESNISMFKKSAGELLPDVLDTVIPPIPEVLPDLPVPNKHVDGIREEVIPAEKQLELATDFDLEPLEDVAIRRRKKKRLIIDEKTRLSSDYIRKRIDDKIELRCQKYSDDAIKIDKVPVDILFRRSAVASSGLTFGRLANGFGGFGGRIANELVYLFEHGLSLPEAPVTHLDNELETMLRQQRQHPTLQTIQENETLQDIQPMQVSYHVEDEVVAIQAHKAHVGAPAEIENINKQMDMTVLPTHILEELPVNRQSVRKDLLEPPTKRKCLRGNNENVSSGFVRYSRGAKENIEVQYERTRVEPQTSAQKQPDIEIDKTREEASVSGINEEASKRNSSDETQLGSLDRTKVSLFSHHEESDAKKYLNAQWNSAETFQKIVKARRLDPGAQLDVHKLVKIYPSTGETPARFAAAKCFMSLLRLSQHGYIVLEKDPESKEIIDINLKNASLVE